MTGEPPRPLPQVNELNAHFWAGGADGRLHIMQCGSCARWHHPAVARCAACGSADVTPQPVSGKATVAGFTVNHQPWVAGVPVPYVVAIVELVEQSDIRLMTNMPRTPIERVRIGLPVSVYFEPIGDIHLPLFEESAA